MLDMLLRNRTPTPSLAWGYFSQVSAILQIKSYSQQIIGGALGTIVWIALIFNLKKFAERSAIVWTTSITIGWFLVVVLLFPWINSIKTYKYMVEDLVQHIPSNAECVSRVRIREPQRAMLDYFGNLMTIPIENRFKSERCDFLLVEGEWALSVTLLINGNESGKVADLVMKRNVTIFTVKK